MGWIMACIFIPYGGPAAYFLFGINRVRSRARGMKRRLFAVEYEAGPRRVPAGSAVSYGLSGPGEMVTGKPLSAGNAVSTFHNGENAYPAMLASINHAKQQVLLATYILKSDKTGSAFADALGAAVSRGVNVMVLVDGIGELYSWPRPSRLLARRNITVARFLPPKLFPPSIYLNLRNHRKLLIVDQDIAYAGGMNISDDHTSKAGRPRRISDVHFSFRGPIVADFAAVFCADWQFTSGASIQADKSRQIAGHGRARCRVIRDGPDDAMDALALTIQAVISAASESVEIMTPYFLPSRDLISALQSAVLRGVRVRIVLPAKNNLFYVHWANTNMLTELLRWGIEAFYQPAPFCHSKLLCVDREYCMVGSANLDPRSLRLNFELGIEVFSAELNSELRAHFESVIAASAPVTHEQLSNRSVPVRLRDSFVSLFMPYF